VFGDERHVLSAVEAGALGYLLKDGRAGQLAAAILEMLAGGSPISAPIARQLLRRLQPAEAGEAAGPAAKPEAPRLSRREHEVLRYVVKGFNVPETARIMEVSPHTVTTHVRSIYRKLSVNSRGEAIYEALQLGLVQIDE
jgi:DNA-binding NarL/FixJ family response regulator